MSEEVVELFHKMKLNVYFVTILVNKHINEHHHWDRK